MTAVVIHRSGRGRPLVAFAEDDAGARAALRGALEPTCDLAECDGPAALLDYLARAAGRELPYPDLLLMSDGAGSLDALSHVADEAPCLPVLLLTASPPAPRVLDPRQVVVTLERPLEAERLVRWVDAACAAFAGVDRRRPGHH